jgi:hypothetical protein
VAIPAVLPLTGGPGAPAQNSSIPFLLALIGIILIGGAGAGTFAVAVAKRGRS